MYEYAWKVFFFLKITFGFPSYVSGSVCPKNRWTAFDCLAIKKLHRLIRIQQTKLQEKHTKMSSDFNRLSIRLRNDPTWIRCCLDIVLSLRRLFTYILDSWSHAPNFPNVRNFLSLLTNARTVSENKEKTSAIQFVFLQLFHFDSNFIFIIKWFFIIKWLFLDLYWMNNVCLKYYPCTNWHLFHRKILMASASVSRTMNSFLKRFLSKFEFFLLQIVLANIFYNLNNPSSVVKISSFQYQRNFECFRSKFLKFP